jgi:hypothetical protein
MKSFLLRIHQSSHGYFRKGVPILLAAATLFLAGNEANAWVAAGGAGRGIAVAGRGYGYGYGYGGARYGAVAVGYRGGLPAGYYGAIPGAYRPVVYGGYNCYYAGGVYYRPAFYQGSTVYIVVR